MKSEWLFAGIDKAEGGIISWFSKELIDLEIRSEKFKETDESTLKRGVRVNGHYYTLTDGVDTRSNDIWWDRGSGRIGNDIVEFSNNLKEGIFFHLYVLLNFRGVV
jgi:hypothetical protein